MTGEGVAGPTALAAAVGFCAVLGLATLAGHAVQPPPAPTIGLPTVAPPDPGVVARP